MEQVLFYFSRDLDELAPVPAIWSCDTGQRIPCFDSCQLTLIGPCGAVLLILNDGGQEGIFGGRGGGWDFRFQDFLGRKIWQVVFWVAWFKCGFLGGIQNYLKLLFCIVLLLKQKMFLVVSNAAMKSYRNRHKHSISNIFIFCIVSFNAFW